MKTAATTLILCVGGLLAVGLVMLYSSSTVQTGARYLMLQGAYCALGVVICTMAACCDYRWLKPIAWILFAVTVLLLLLVLVPGIGVYKGGARRWFNLGFTNFQPSEAAKLVLIITLAMYGEKFQQQMRSFRNGLVVPGAIASCMLIPIFLEPDRGTTILLCALTGSMLLIAGVRWLYLLPPGALLVAGFGWILMTDPVRRARILSWLNPEETKTATGYQSWQAMLALGSGGTTGLGLGNGRQKLGFVPEHHTDFIFSIIGEELGFVATCGIVALFIVFVICGIYIAWHARDVFGLLLGSGITLLISMQACFNIGVVTSALPNKGLPLPLISYGGSSLVLTMLSIGVLISIARQSQRVPVEEVEETDLRQTQYA